MQPRDWALVAFTLLMQASVGTLLVAAAVSAVTANAVGGPARAFTLALTIATLAGGLALGASLVHLGHPAQAWLALRNVRSSWLSREVAASIVFVALLAVLLLARRRVDETAISLPAVVVGLFVLIAMSRLYMVPAQPAWDRGATPLAFFITALLLGTVIVVALSALAPSVSRQLALVAMALVIVQCLITAAFFADLPAEPSAAISAASLGTIGGWLTGARVAAAIVAMVMLAAGGGNATSPLFRIAAIVFVLLSELAARVLFYTGAASIGPF